MPDELSIFELITLIALVAGPVIAVLIARHLDDRRAKRNRQLDIFRTLMRTRRMTISPDHVGALNLVEIEFQEVPSVINEWTVYINHLFTEHSKLTNEQTDDKTSQEEWGRRTDIYNKRINGERAKLLAKLLHSISRVLNFKIEQLDIFEGGYMPVAWNDIEMQQEAIRRFAVGLYLGTHKVPVAVTDYVKSPMVDSKDVDSKNI